MPLIVMRLLLLLLLLLLFFAIPIYFITAAADANKDKWWHGFFQKVSKENTVYFTCRALTYLKKKNRRSTLRWPDICVNESCQLEQMPTQTSVLISLYNKDSNGYLKVTFTFTRFNGFMIFFF